MQQVATRTLVNGVGAQVSLCEMCAVQVGGSPSMHKMLMPVLMGEVLPAVNACPNCRTTLRQLHQSSLLGCAECYRYFREPLQATVHRLQGASCHRGRRPRGADGADLKEMLEAAVSEQRFEDAAQLRDRIRALQPPREAP